MRYNLILGLFLIACCSLLYAQETLSLDWQPVDSLNQKLPQGIRLFQAVDDQLPLRAWYVRVQEKLPEIRTQVVVSDDTTDNRETVSSFARDLNACIVVNGGYFTMGKTPADHVGLIVDDGKILWPATASVMRDSIAYPTTRATLAFTPDEKIHVGYAGDNNQKLLWSESPADNQPGKPATESPLQPTETFIAADMISAGPRLLKDGEIFISDNQEIFFGTSIPKTHPRTAAGVAENGDLLLLVVDGRQEISRGVNLVELAQIMQQIGAIDALNLDGGGSSTMVVAGTLVNRPTGGIFQRQVMSALAVFCQ